MPPVARGFGQLLAAARAVVAPEVTVANNKIRAAQVGPTR